MCTQYIIIVYVYNGRKRDRGRPKLPLREHAGHTTLTDTVR